MVEQPGKNTPELVLLHLGQQRGVCKPRLCTAALSQNLYVSPWEHPRTCLRLHHSYLSPGTKFLPACSVLQWKGSSASILCGCRCRHLQGVSTEPAGRASPAKLRTEVVTQMCRCPAGFLSQRKGEINMRAKAG